MNAGEFITTDVFGTFVLLEAAREATHLKKFVQISTDEVYGSVAEGSSKETDELRPRNPYSASKAGADRLAYSYWATYNVPVVISRASNNYGPNQFPEKVIPLFITNAIDDIPVPLYGDGQNVRDWLHVSDNCRALDCHPRARRAGRGVQHRRRQSRQERRSDAPDPGAARQARERDQAGGGSARARSPLLARHHEAAGARLDPARAVRAGPGRYGRVVPRRTSGGGVRSRNRTPPSRRTTRRSTASGGADAGRGRTSARHRRDRLRRQPSARRSASRSRARWPRGPIPAARRRRRDAQRALAVGRPRRSRRGRRGDRGPRTVGRLSPRRARHTSATRGRTRRARCGQRARHASPARSHPASPSCNVRCSSPGPRWCTGPRPMRSTKKRRSVRRTPTASASWRRRWWPRATRGRRSFLTRPFNHVGPRQSPAYVASSFARQIAQVEAGTAGAGLSVGNLDARRDLTDVRDTVRAYRRWSRSGRPARPYNVCSGRAYRIGDLLETMLRLARMPITITRDPTRHAAERQRRSCSATRRGSRAEVGWRPTIPIEDTLEDLLDYWRQRVAVTRA